MANKWKRSNQILISYRREDSPTITGRIYDRLTQKFGREVVFKDVDSMPYGINFRKHLEEIISECAAVLVVIGGKWMACDEKSGKSRLDDPRDFVRIEIESALKRDIPVIPLLVESALLPEAESLPESLRELCDRHGLEVGQDPHFHSDLSRLIDNLEGVMADATKLTNTLQNATFDPLPVSKPLPPLPYTPNPEEERKTLRTNEPEADVHLTDSQQETPSREVYKDEPEVTRKLHIAALFLGMILPGAFAAAGGFAGRLLVSSSSVVTSEMSGVLLAELGAVYALVVTGFLIGRKCRQALLRVALLISAFSIAINLGGSLPLLFRGSGSSTTSFFLITAFCITPIMPLLAYAGLHLGMLYSSRQAKSKNTVHQSQVPEKTH